MCSWSILNCKAIDVPLECLHVCYIHPFKLISTLIGNGIDECNLKFIHKCTWYRFKLNEKKISQTVMTLQILRRLGEGGYGLVFQVVNMQNPVQMAAMKTEPFGMLNDDQILKMEVHVLKKLDKSQHACKIYAVGKVIVIGCKSALDVLKISREVYSFHLWFRSGNCINPNICTYDALLIPGELGRTTNKYFMIMASKNKHKGHQMKLKFAGWQFLFPYNDFTIKIIMWIAKTLSKSGLHCNKIGKFPKKVWLPKYD